MPPWIGRLRVSHVDSDEIWNYNGPDNPEVVGRDGYQTRRWLAFHLGDLALITFFNTYSEDIYIQFAYLCSFARLGSFGRTYKGSLSFQRIVILWVTDFDNPALLGWFFGLGIRVAWPSNSNSIYRGSARFYSSARGMRCGDWSGGIGVSLRVVAARFISRRSILAVGLGGLGGLGNISTKCRQVTQVLTASDGDTYRTGKSARFFKF